MTVSGIPNNIFPGFTSMGVITDQLAALITTFNAEGVEALQMAPEKAYAWADIGTRTVKMNIGEGRIPVRLTSLLGFEEFEGERHFKELNVSANAVRVAPWQLNLQWPIQINTSGIAELQNYYGVSGVAGDVVRSARMFKAKLAASVLINGMTNSNLSMTARANTLPQPGYPTGLPLFSDGSTSGASTHYSNPLDGNSAKFKNLYLNAGKFQDALGDVLTNMSQIPHPSETNMTLGLEVTDFFGPTNMLIPFYQAAVQTLSIQGTTNFFGAATNVLTNEMLAQAKSMIGVNGLAPWRFHICPQLDAHPYHVAHPTNHMWFAVSAGAGNTGTWCNFGGPSDQLTPQITLLGPGTETAALSRKVSLIGDLDAGAAAGLPHFVAAYFETTP